MCAFDDCDTADIWTHRDRKARVPHRCRECGRTVAPGETYRLNTWLYDGRWSTSKTCQHCLAAGSWLDEVCGGYPVGMLREELVEHWHEGFRSVPFARLIAGQKRRWHDGRDPIPEGVAALANQMMQGQVAA